MAEENILRLSKRRDRSFLSASKKHLSGRAQRWIVGESAAGKLGSPRGIGIAVDVRYLADEQAICKANCGLAGPRGWVRRADELAARKLYSGDVATAGDEAEASIVGKFAIGE